MVEIESLLFREARVGVRAGEKKQPEPVKNQPAPQHCQQVSPTLQYLRFDGDNVQHRSAQRSISHQLLYQVPKRIKCTTKAVRIYNKCSYSRLQYLKKHFKNNKNKTTKELLESNKGFVLSKLQFLTVVIFYLNLVISCIRLCNQIFGRIRIRNKANTDQKHWSVMLRIKKSVALC